MNTFIRLCCLCLLPMLLSSCVTRVDSTTPVLQETEDYPEEALLDITILPFASRYARTRAPDDGLDAYRWMEGFFAAHTTAATLTQTKGFGSIRMDFKVRPGSDLFIRGRVVRSDPRLLSLHISVEDATGQHWYTRQYLQELEYSDYEAAEAAGAEPFQNMYNHIANDLLTFRQTLTATQARSIRLTAAMLFAREFSPEAFSEYLQQQADGSMTLERLPPENDPVFQKMAPVTQHHQLFLQAQHTQVEQFYATIAGPYFDLRKGLMEIRNYLTSNINTFIQTVPEAPGVPYGQIYNQMVTMASYQNTRQFSVNLQPLVFTLGNQVVTLRGSVEEQYQEWKALLKQLYLLDRGLEDPQLAEQDEAVSSVP